MTRYRWEVSVPAATSQDGAVTSAIQIDERKLTDGLLFAPPGTAGRIKAELKWGETVILPSANSSRTVIPGTTDPTPINRLISGSPYELTLRAWAPNATKGHTVTARVDAVREGEDVQDVRVVSRRSGRSRPRRRPSPQDIMREDGEG